MQDKPQSSIRTCVFCKTTIPSSLYQEHLDACGIEKEKEQRAIPQKVRDSKGSKKTFTKQSKTQHTGPQRKMCELCGQFVILSKWDEHPKDCTNCLQKCQNCHQQFPLALMVQHTRQCLEYQESQAQSQQTFYEEESDGEFDSTISSSSMETGVALFDSTERRIYLLRRLNQFVTEIQQITEIEEIVGGMHLQLALNIRILREQIERRALEAAGRGGRGLRREQIDNIPARFCRTQQSQSETCSICLQAFTTDDKVKDIKCGHLYHVDCIQPWLRHNKKCPLCNQVVTAAIRKQQQPMSSSQRMIQKWFDPEGSQKKQKK